MTQCVDPTELAEGALWAYAEGQPNAQVHAHLEHCSYCAAQVASYRRTLAHLAGRLYRYDCPLPEQLGLYQLKLLPASEQLVMAQHVRECPHCQRDLLELARTDNAPSVLDKLHQAVNVIEAVLLSPLRQPVTALRGTQPTLQRFQTAALEIHLQQQPGHRHGHWTLMGRLVPLTDVPLSVAEVWLLQEPHAWAAPVEADGIFSFAELVAGVYELTLEWENQ